MKKSYIYIVLFSFFIVPFAFAGQTVPSQIKEVTLFSGQALVKREAFTTVQKGLNELLLEIEAFRVDSDSVTAKVFGAGEIFSVQFKKIPIKEPPQDNIKVMEQKINELKKSKRLLSDQREVLNKEEAFLVSLIDFSKTQIPREIKTSFPNMEDLTKTLSFLSSNFQQINKEKQSLDASIEEVEKEIKVLEEQLSALRGPVEKVRKVIEILFNAEREQKIRIQADYLTKNANWEPLYKVSVPMTLSEIDLTMFSKILQKTGEDWKRVALSISNVIPLSGVRLPSLSSWLLDIPRPRAEVMRKAGRLAYEKAAPPMDVVKRKDYAEMPEQEAAFTTAVKSELPLSFEYRIPQPIDIESRDKETVLPLFTKKTQGDSYYYAVPRRSPLTFLVCKTKADKELLSGPLNVYFGGRYIGKTYLGEKKAGEEFHLSLGADREVMVKREKVKDKIKETYFGKIQRGTIVRELAYKITVENIKERSISLKVLDSIPVSRTDKIEVKDLKMNPEPAKENYLDKEGVMLWEYKLDPEEKQEINIELVVTYPKGLLPMGL
ncbi:MAG: mucoidy inhibitor MuiA family protein [Desulfobacterales bacterium]|nr:mucoidy inhibitor MuiA family protein [Desulfobacterales bacterium]